MSIDYGEINEEHYYTEENFSNLRLLHDVRRACVQKQQSLSFSRAVGRSAGRQEVVKHS